MNMIKPFTPMQYIIGRCSFLDMEIMVDERVLIPRPETELVVEVAASILSVSFVRGARILDLCTGSGNIALSLTNIVHDCTITASDVSKEALDVARSNAVLNGLQGRVRFIESDLFDRIDEVFDLIVSNPPYIAAWEFESLQREVLHEPRLALYGGEDGLDYYRKIFSRSPCHLKIGGYVVVEIGFGQLQAIKKIISSTQGFVFKASHNDYNGIPRVVVAQWTN